MKDFTMAEAASGGGLHPTAQMGTTGPFVKSDADRATGG